MKVKTRQKYIFYETNITKIFVFHVRFFQTLDCVLLSRVLISSFCISFVVAATLLASLPSLPQWRLLVYLSTCLHYTTSLCHSILYRYFYSNVCWPYCQPSHTLFVTPLTYNLLDK